MKTILFCLICLAVIGCGKPSSGTGQAAGPFEISLTTNPQPPAAGSVELIAKVMKNGAPVSDAQVSVATSMTSMSMPGGSATLQAVSGQPGEYSGSVNLMGGGWQVEVTASSGSDTGKATFNLDVK